MFHHRLPEVPDTSLLLLEYYEKISKTNHNNRFKIQTRGNTTDGKRSRSPSPMVRMQADSPQSPPPEPYPEPRSPSPVSLPDLDGFDQEDMIWEWLGQQQWDSGYESEDETREVNPPQPQIWRPREMPRLILRNPSGLPFVERPRTS